jgi:hypothetical protein
MHVFEKSISSEIFQTYLNDAIKVYKASKDTGSLMNAEADLRDVLTVFKQSKHLQPYKFPEESFLEMASESFAG